MLEHLIFIIFFIILKINVNKNIEDLTINLYKLLESIPNHKYYLFSNVMLVFAFIKLKKLNLKLIYAIIDIVQFTIIHYIRYNTRNKKTKYPEILTMYIAACTHVATELPLILNICTNKDFNKTIYFSIGNIIINTLINGLHDDNMEKLMINNATESHACVLTFLIYYHFKIKKIKKQKWLICFLWFICHNDILFTMINRIFKLDLLYYDSILVDNIFTLISIMNK